MAIRCTSYEPGFNIASFTADTPADVSNPDLPTLTENGKGEFENMKPIGMGSDILVIEPSQVWMLNSEGIWKEL